MSIEERLLIGLKGGVDRHRSYTKDLLRIKPEYILTVSVADALVDGFGNFDALDIQIRLEEPTNSVLFEIVAAAGGKKWFKEARPKISRKGKVDIFVIIDKTCHADKTCYAVELKGFDPSRQKLNMDIVRLKELLAVNDGNNNLTSCHIVFPTQTNCTQWIEECAKTGVNSKTKFETKQEKYTTNEEPGNGILCYYANCLTLTRR